MYVHISICVCESACLCQWRFVRWQPVRVSDGESATRYVLDNTTRGRQRGTCGVWRFNHYLCTLCVCVSQDAPMLDADVEPTEEECVFLLYIHHLSSLCSRRPSLETLLLCSTALPPWAPLMSTPQADTVQHGLVAAPALE